MRHLNLRCSALFRSRDEGRVASTATVGLALCGSAAGAGETAALQGSLAASTALLAELPQRRHVLGDGFVPSRYRSVDEIWGEGD